MKAIEIMDSTLRDAQQSLWATRMPTSIMTPIARTMDAAGFHIIDLAGGAVMDACIMYLREDPFERMRILRALMPNTPLNFLTRGQTVFRWNALPDDVIDLTLKTVARNGIRTLKTFEPLNDMRNLAHTIKVGKEIGLHVIGCVSYTCSPVHTDELFVQKARELVEMGVDAVELKDPSALLTPERVRTLLPAMKAVIGDRARFHLHTHCTAGLGPATYVEALKTGCVDVFHTVSSPLSQGTSLPSHEFLVEQARAHGCEVRVNLAALQEMAGYFHWAARRLNKPLGQPMPYDPANWEHQVPGGMISNLVSQLTELGLQDRLPEVIREVVRVREELGYPIMISPMAQYVAVQALFNVVHGERYKVVPVEIKQYALGWYGQLAAPIHPDVLDRITGGEQPITERPGALLEPMVERFRAQNGPFHSDEELLLAICYSQKTLEEYVAARQNSAAGVRATTPLAFLIRELGQRGDLEYCRVEKGDLRLTQRF